MPIATGPSIEDLTGKYTSVKSLSDNADKALAMQGVPWLVRKALGMTSVVSGVKQSKDANGVVHMEVTMTVGPKTKSETRVLDWSEVHQKDPAGDIIAQSRYYTELELAAGGTEDDRKFLSGESLSGGAASSWSEIGSDEHIQLFNRAANGSWKSETTWGFEMIDGVKYHTRRVVVYKGKDVERVRYVYSYE